MSDPALPRVLAEAIADFVRRAEEQARVGEPGGLLLKLGQGPGGIGALVVGPHGQDRRTYGVGR